MHDILIRGGLVYDGSGTPGAPGDVAIRDGRIAAIGPRIEQPAGKTIDASGLAVAPGFIDIKTHSDFTLPINPKAESKVRQGVTTEIIGHCGFSVAPCLPGKVELLKDYLSPSAPWTPFRELTFPQYLDTFPNTSVNAGMLVGHNTLRLMTMGMSDREPSASELGPDDRSARTGPARGRARAVLRAVHPAGLLRQARRDARARPRAEGAQRRLLHPPARRVRSRARRGAGGDRRGRGLPRARGDRALQVLGHQQLGQGRDRAQDDRGCEVARPRHRLRRLSLCRGLQPAEEPAAAMGAGRRRAGDARSG